MRIALGRFTKTCVVLDSDGYKQHPACSPYWKAVDYDLFSGRRPCFVTCQGVLVTLPPWRFDPGQGGDAVVLD